MIKFQNSRIKKALGTQFSHSTILQFYHSVILKFKTKP
jgi:hypothetical protein